MIRVVACLDRPPAESGRVVTDMPPSVYQYSLYRPFRLEIDEIDARSEYTRARAQGNAEKEISRALAFERYLISPAEERFSFFFFFFSQAHRTYHGSYVKVTRCIGHSRDTAVFVERYTSVYRQHVSVLRHSMRRDTPRSRFCFANTRCS